MVKVLIVNHEQELMLLLKKYLECDSFQATYIKGSNDVKEEDMKFMPDVFLIDAPQSQCIRGIKDEGVLSAIPILMMTSKITSADSIPTEVDDVICKPFEGPLLKAKLQSLANSF